MLVVRANIKKRPHISNDREGKQHKMVKHIINQAKISKSQSIPPHNPPNITNLTKNHRIHKHDIVQNQITTSSQRLQKKRQ